MAEPAWSEGDETQEHDQEDPDRLLRPIVWIISLFVVIVLIGIPLIRLIDYSRDQTPALAAEEARNHVAVQFAMAALGRRSTHQAEQWAIPGLHDSIDAVVLDLQLRDAAELADTTLRVTTIPCVAVSDPTAECYRARLVAPSGRVVSEVELTVAIVDGKAQVVRVGLPG